MSTGHAPVTDSETPAGRGGLKEPPQIMVIFRHLQKTLQIFSPSSDELLMATWYIRANAGPPSPLREIIYLYIYIPAMFSSRPVQLA